MRVHFHSTSIIFILPSLALFVSTYFDFIKLSTVKIYIGQVTIIAFISVFFYTLISTIILLLIAQIFKRLLSKKRQPPLRMRAGETYKTPLLGYKWLNRLCVIKISWPDWPTVDVVCSEGAECALAHTRGSARHLRRELHLTDPLNMISCYIQVIYPEIELIITPHQLSYSPELNLTSNSGDGDISAEGKRSGDLTDYRFYQEGDLLSRVIWRLSDKLPEGQLLVRTQDISSHTSCALYLSLGIHDPPLVAYITHQAKRICEHTHLLITSSMDQVMYQFREEAQLIQYLIERSPQREQSCHGWSHEDFIEACRVIKIAKAIIFVRDLEEAALFDHIIGTSGIDVQVYSVVWRKNNLNNQTDSSHISSPNHVILKHLKGI